MVRGMWCSAALQRRLMQRKRFSCRELTFENVSNLRIVRVRIGSLSKCGEPKQIDLLHKFHAEVYMIRILKSCLIASIHPPACHPCRQICTIGPTFRWKCG
jgi:hypothetical protein